MLRNCGKNEFETNSLASDSELDLLFNLNRLKTLTERTLEIVMQTLESASTPTGDLTNQITCNLGELKHAIDTQTIRVDTAIYDESFT